MTEPMPRPRDVHEQCVDAADSLPDYGIDRRDDSEDSDNVLTHQNRYYCIGCTNRQFRA